MSDLAATRDKKEEDEWYHGWNELSLFDDGREIREWLLKLTPDEADRWMEKKREEFANCYREYD